MSCCVKFVDCNLHLCLVTSCFTLVICHLCLILFSTSPVSSSQICSHCVPLFPLASLPFMFIVSVIYHIPRSWSWQVKNKRFKNCGCMSLRSVFLQAQVQQVFCICKLRWVVSWLSLSVSWKCLNKAVGNINSISDLHLKDVAILIHSDRSGRVVYSNKITTCSDSVTYILKKSIFGRCFRLWESSFPCMQADVAHLLCSLEVISFISAISRTELLSLQLSYSGFPPQACFAAYSFVTKSCTLLHIFQPKSSYITVIECEKSMER